VIELTYEVLIALLGVQAPQPYLLQWILSQPQEQFFNLMFYGGKLRFSRQNHEFRLTNLLISNHDCKEHQWQEGGSIENAGLIPLHGIAFYCLATIPAAEISPDWLCHEN